MKKRSVRLFALGLASVFAFSGCANSNIPNGASTSQSSAEASTDEKNEAENAKNEEAEAEEAEAEDKADNESASAETTETEEAEAEETEAEDKADNESASAETTETEEAEAKEAGAEETEAEETEAEDVASAEDTEAAEEHAEGKYPVKWDLTQVYATPEEWNADYDKVMEMLKEYDKYKGTLNNAQNIYDYLKFASFSELTNIQTKLYTYAYLGTTLDATDSVFNEMNTKLATMSTEESRLNSFAIPEIFSLSIDERKKIFSDPVFEGMEYLLKDYVDPDFEPLTEDETKLLATISPGLGYSYNIYDILNNVELPYPMLEMPDGTEVELTTNTYNDIVYSDQYDEEFKAKTNQLYLTRYKGYANTFAALLEETCKQAYANAQIMDYDSTLEYQLSNYDLDTDVYYTLVDAAHEGIDDYHRYLDIHAKGLGLEKQYPYHMATYVSDFDPGKVEYDDAVDEVLEALSVLGTEYTDVFKTIVNNGNVDVYTTDTKNTGAAEYDYSQEFYPFVYYNYNGYSNDVSNIAHEMGHAVYDEFAGANQPSYNTFPSIYTHEVASTTNELLYYTYKINNAKDDEEKLYYIENVLDMFTNTFYSQVMFSEFEDYMYKTVESGSTLAESEMGDKWMELANFYRGDYIISFPDYRYYWAAISHFHRNYYVYQYAADVAYAASIVEKITSGDENAVQDYIDFLKLGSSMSPVDLLTVAGVDPTSKDTFEYALDYYRKLVDEYEALVEKKN